jgi:RimJ/RimL family protein N-acetyltransferase
LPTLRGRQLHLRELRLDDAAPLLALLTREEVARFISPPPSTIAEFQRFIEWAHDRRREGSYVCFAVVPEGHDLAVGIFQVRALDSDWSTAEWGFALGVPYWGTGLFVDGAMQVVSFAFETLGVRRLEARACVENGRGTGALRKIGASCERILRGSFVKAGRVHDQALWTILRDEWLALTRVWTGIVH